MTIPIRTKTPDGWTITPSQPKSFRNIIAEASARIARELCVKLNDEPALDEIAREAVEHRHQRADVRRTFKGE
jgi:hypothetical protein